MKKLSYDLYQMGPSEQFENKDNNNLIVDGDIQNGKIVNITSIKDNDNNVLIKEPEVLGTYKGIAADDIDEVILEQLTFYVIAYAPEEEEVTVKTNVKAFLSAFMSVGATGKACTMWNDAGSSGEITITVNDSGYTTTGAVIENITITSISVPGNFKLQIAKILTERDDIVSVDTFEDSYVTVTGQSDLKIIK